ncbi:ABC transporter substrate-binding protein [Haloarcula mannanilytica]|uniref:ABC transporter substrate-binding protein n=1 Tax=Haloarcula mannanilytica TaxID=2509225 RepID=A0A4C2EPB5_9EURY|nr:extracellular solute-binding protein [Haloarcula mannanilytica]GCF16165.1 ABC transporter substrate-binding protein [Haloarcula mannanilytica]
MRNINRRRVLKGITTAGAIGLAGCQSGNSSENGNGASSGTVQITLRERDDPMAAYEPGFNEAQENIELTASIQPPEEKYRSLISEINAGKAPEVVGLDVIYLPRFVQLGALSDLGSLNEDLGHDDYFEPLTPDFTTWNDTVHALPFWIDCSVYLYNKAHFEEAGIDPESPPTTFQEFLDASRAIRDNTDYTPLSLNLAGSNALGLELFFFMPHVWAGDGKLFNEEMTECLIDEQPAIDAVNFFKTMVEEDLCTDPTSNDTWTLQSFMNQETSMAYSAGFISHIEEESPEVWDNMATAMFPKPEGGTQSSFLGGNSVVIPKGITENEEKFNAAKEFVRWSQSEDGMRTTVEDIGYLPPRQSGLETEFVEENGHLYDAFTRAMEQGHAPPMHPKTIEMQDPLNNALARALLGEQEVEPALSEAKSKIDKILQG